ncbi:MAG: ISAs1 family transposase [Candidatus Moranbacteria bacterium]|nr:ISAs1 family transposase [Candidatus Moranbacteria bacterium]
MKQYKEGANLFELLKKLKDHRRKQGTRHPLPIVIIIIIMGIMSGAKGERAISRFAKNNKKELIKMLKIERKKVPSRKVMRIAIQNINFDELEEIFYRWSLSQIKIKKGEWINIDGKAIASTLSEHRGKFQNFISLVTCFVNKKKQALKVGRIENKKESEIPKVKELIENLGLKGAIFTMDALHCQKKL